MPRTKKNEPQAAFPSHETRVVKPENPEISFNLPPDENGETIPDQQEHFALPTRFGALPVDEAVARAIVAEARDAFARHVALFEELHRPPG